MTCNWKERSRSRWQRFEKIRSTRRRTEHFRIIISPSRSAGCPRLAFPLETMLYMVIEHFKDRDAVAVYRRFREKGRMMPDGLRYIDSWIEPNFDRCFQLMETSDKALFEQWTVNWDDLMDFEIVAVATSRDTRDEIEPLL